MAKPTGPLFSLAATGTLGKTTVYQGGPVGPFARKWVQTPQPGSPAQLKHKELMAWLNSFWIGAPAEMQRAFGTIGPSSFVPPRQKFLGANLKALNGATDNSTMVASSGLGKGVPPDTISAVPTNTTIDVTITQGPVPNGWTNPFWQMWLCKVQTISGKFSGGFQSTGGTFPANSHSFGGLSPTTAYFIAAYVMATNTFGNFTISPALTLVSTTT